MPYKGGRRDPAELRYDPMIYTPEGAKLLTEKDLRKEYSRLRSIARKRLERMGASEWSDSQVYQQNAGKYKALKDIENPRELRHLFSDLARFITAKTSSARGLDEQRSKAVNTLNDHGYDFVTVQNFREFADFMEYARIANLNKIYDSKGAADVFKFAEKRKMSRDQLYAAFHAWRRNQRKQRKKIQHKNPRNSAMYRKDLYK